MRGQKKSINGSGAHLLEEIELGHRVRNLSGPKRHQRPERELHRCGVRPHRGERRSEVSRKRARGRRLDLIDTEHTIAYTRASMVGTSRQGNVCWVTTGDGKFQQLDSGMKLQPSSWARPVLTRKPSSPCGARGKRNTVSPLGFPLRCERTTSGKGNTDIGNYTYDAQGLNLHVASLTLGQTLQRADQD